MSYQFSNIKILVVESSHAMFNLTKSVLTAFGVSQIISAYDTETGFKEFVKHNPDLVILDWLQEPDNGLELTKQIRTSHLSPNPFVPIIMMTGFSQKKRVIMARDSGVTEFVVKPFTAKTLYQRMEQIIENPRQFVRSPDFFGPDRRRKAADAPYDGPERREENLDEGEDRRRAGEKDRRSIPSGTARKIRDKTKENLNKGDKSD